MRPSPSQATTSSSTVAAPIILFDIVSAPTISALARGRRRLDSHGRPDGSLAITCGLPKPKDFIKALAFGADANALSNAAMQAIGCSALRASHTNTCLVEIAPQTHHLVSRVASRSSEAAAIHGPAPRPQPSERVLPARPHNLETRCGGSFRRVLW
ncbi:MAG: glutamate synthase-related protein [Pseudomonadota bacterium]